MDHRLGGKTVVNGQVVPAPNRGPSGLPHLTAFDRAEIKRKAASDAYEGSDSEGDNSEKAWLNNRDRINYKEMSDEEDDDGNDEDSDYHDVPMPSTTVRHIKRRRTTVPKVGSSGARIEKKAGSKRTKALGKKPQQVATTARNATVSDGKPSRKAPAKEAPRKGSLTSTVSTSAPTRSTTTKEPRLHWTYEMRFVLHQLFKEDVFITKQETGDIFNHLFQVELTQLGFQQAVPYEKMRKAYSDSTRNRVIRDCIKIVADELADEMADESNAASDLRDEMGIEVVYAAELLGIKIGPQEEELVV
ncbi:uncharacterized protein RCC_09924 [Ramularia collo-cygni]|uniref:Uncharacterized protein n=1 Tax=Ramularia collo-cygni TaxID=112498 RepID=A0A2D3V1K5_9PEZI|nr:uncharacterized protein RCC_09924 [Ramularia collo-cygni]CZT24207.1 uncharacterized protein RCC_09924 [Ramularia collo-cygni]